MACSRLRRTACQASTLGSAIEKPPGGESPGSAFRRGMDKWKFQEQHRKNVPLPHPDLGGRYHILAVDSPDMPTNITVAGTELTIVKGPNSTQGTRLWTPSQLPRPDELSGCNSDARCHRLEQCNLARLAYDLIYEHSDEATRSSAYRSAQALSLGVGILTGAGLRTSTRPSRCSTRA